MTYLVKYVPVEPDVSAELEADRQEQVTRHRAREAERRAAKARMRLNTQRMAPPPVIHQPSPVRGMAGQRWLVPVMVGAMFGLLGIAWMLGGHSLPVTFN